MARVLFVPYALADHDGYVRLMTERGLNAGYELDGIHRHADPVAAVHEAEAIFVGGGNTFRLLAALYRLGLLDPIRERVRGGLPYLGVSAGTNVACPTIRTTNDMPIVQPPSLDALGLVPFQVNAALLHRVELTSDMVRSSWSTSARPATTGCASSTRRTRRRWSACGRAASCASRAAG